MTAAAIALVSALIWWLLYASILALFSGLLSWVILRWAERSNVVFNRVYFANLLWHVLSIALIAGVAAHAGRTRPPYAPLLALPTLRIGLVLDMLVGTLLLWRLVPRIDAHRIRPGSACLAAAVVMAIGFGIATSVA